jgi:CheY-like chemotaxis protein
VEIIVLPSIAEAADLHALQPLQAIVANAENSEQMSNLCSQRHGLPPHLPLILTGFPALADAANLAGVADYLVKPVTRQKLMAALAALPQPVQTVLVADDEIDTAHLFDRMFALETQAYQLLQAVNGREALHLLRTRRPDVLLLDLAMPELDGHALLQEKNADPLIRAIPVVIISAHDRSEEPLTATAVMITSQAGIPAPAVLHLLATFSARVGGLSSTPDPMPLERPGG